MSSLIQIAQNCQQQNAWLTETTRALVALESPSNDKRALDTCGRELAARISGSGGRVQTIASATAGDHLRAEFGSGARQVLLLGHFDTVWPIGQLSQMPLAQDGDSLRGPGVLDMKAGIAIALVATRALFSVASPSARVVMLWTTDEETGSHSSRALIEREAQASEAVLVFEPSLPDGSLKTSRKGCGEYEVVVHGTAAHAGVDPGKGVSAIRELARQLLALETLDDHERGITINAGLIHGGSRPNVIAAEARATVDIRVRTRADSEEIDTAMRALTTHLPGARLEVHGGFSRPPMERSEGTVRLFTLAQEAAAALGQPAVSEGTTGGGSDGSFTAALGVPTLDGLGATGDGAHALHEHVRVSSLVPRAALVASLLARLTSR